MEMHLTEKKVLDFDNQKNWSLACTINRDSGELLLIVSSKASMTNNFYKVIVELLQRLD